MDIIKPYEKLFIESGGSYCPFCKEKLYLKDFKIETDILFRSRVIRKAECPKCKRELYILYDLVGCKVKGETLRPYTTK